MVSEPAFCALTLQTHFFAASTSSNQWPNALRDHAAVRDFEDSTLWRVSGYERVRMMTGTSGFVRLDGATLLPSTLLADLDRLEAVGAADDVLEVVAACVRHREAALLCLQYEGLVWPVTLFPQQMLYHSPRDMAGATPQALARIKLLNAEAPGVRPPGHWMYERVAQAEHYRPLEPLLWSLALEGPRNDLLDEIAGTAAYRAVKSPAEEGISLNGALRSAAHRLRRETVPLRTISSWPGMSVERASRLLNGLYLGSALLATRSHPAARAAPSGLREMLLGAKPPRR
jgi:hypothetical protein